jgi:hypothetical protein
MVVKFYKGVETMVKKVVGTILLAIGGFVMIILLSYGGPIFPHIIGPTIVALIGGGVLAFNRKDKKNE